MFQLTKSSLVNTCIKKEKIIYDVDKDTKYGYKDDYNIV